MRERFFRFLRHVASIDDARVIFSELLRQQSAACAVPELAAYDGKDLPYPELRKSGHSAASQREDVVFITARFRTGSTLLWNLFRHLPAVTAYYEPFNERRWFDPRTRGTHTDGTHLEVDDYWSEYDGLEILDAWYSVDWRFSELYMSAQAYNPRMEHFIETLIDRAIGRPVLQFNEVDLRLPWLRARFPHAKILHLYRNPRDQWCSTLGKAEFDMRKLTLRQFELLDGFYLLSWGRDLQHYFPFLTLEPQAHPYELFYQIWRLSYLFGTQHADMSLSFEELTAEPERVLRWMLARLSFDQAHVPALVQLVSPMGSGRWRKQQCDDIYETIEARVDTAFNRYCAAMQRPRPPPAETGAAG